MRQTAKIKAVYPSGKVLAEVIRQGACAHHCTSCGLCSHEAQRIEVTVKNTAQACIGDCVELESRDCTLFGAMALIYMPAPILFFLAYFVCASHVSAGVCAAVSVCAFFLGMIPAVLYDRHLKKNGGIEFTMVRVIEKDTQKGQL